MTISRNPEDYYPSDHAVQRSKDRGIDWETVAATIREGQVKESHKDGCKLFIAEYEYTPHPVGVVVDTSDGEIITVEYRK